MTAFDSRRDSDPSAGTEPAVPAEPLGLMPQETSASYRIAHADLDFMRRPELRAVRLQLELLKAEMVQREQGIESTVVIFGSTQILEPAESLERLHEAECAAEAAPNDPELARRAAVARRLHRNSRYYDEARRLAAMITEVSQRNGHKHFVVVTGGGPGIMEAGNRGAAEAGGKSIGLRIMLPSEERPNPYITPELSLQFQYFAVRKMHFILRARALVVFPGGYGTLDELFETLALIQTGKVEPVPVLLFGREYWERIINLDAMVEEGAIGPAHRDLVQFVERAEDAWAVIRARWPEETGV
jgi:uncharacterized protein (TIGR00730 family)